MPLIQQGEILTCDIVQVGSSTPGSIVHLQIVGLIVSVPPRDQGVRRIPRTNIRPQVNPRRSSNPAGHADFSMALHRIQDILDIVGENNDELVARVRDLELEPRIARYNANLVTPTPLAVATDVMPWVQVTVADGEAWKPIAAWITAKTAPVGDDLIIDVKRANSFSAVDTPEWSSIFPAGDANKLVLPDGENWLTSPITRFI